MLFQRLDMLSLGETMDRPQRCGVVLSQERAELPFEVEYLNVHQSGAVALCRLERLVTCGARGLEMLQALGRGYAMLGTLQPHEVGNLIVTVRVAGQTHVPSTFAWKGTSRRIFHSIASTAKHCGCKESTRRGTI